MIYFTKKDNKVDEIIDSNSHPGEGWFEAPSDWGGYHGVDMTWFNDSFHLMSESERIEKGLHQDFRGVYYNIASRLEEKITELDIVPHKGLTKEKPIENEQYQEFDLKTGKWVIDEAQKKNAANAEKLAKLRNEVLEAERARLRSVMAIYVDEDADEEDHAFNQQFRDKIKQLRREIQLINQVQL